MGIKSLSIVIFKRSCNVSTIDYVFITMVPCKWKVSFMLFLVLLAKIILAHV